MASTSSRKNADKRAGATTPSYIDLQWEMHKKPLRGCCPLIPFASDRVSFNSCKVTGVSKECLKLITAPNPYLNPPEEFTAEQKERLKELYSTSTGALGLVTHVDYPRLPCLSQPLHNKCISHEEPALDKEEEKNLSVVIHFRLKSPTRKLPEFSHERLQYIFTPRFTEPASTLSLTIIVFDNNDFGAAYKNNCSEGDWMLYDIFAKYGASDIHNFAYGETRVTFRDVAGIVDLLENCHYVQDSGYIYCESLEAKRVSLRIVPYWQSLSVYQRYEGFRDDKIFEKPVYVYGVRAPFYAEQLAAVMEATFGLVLYTRFFQDQQGLPTGEAYVIFRDEESYKKAIGIGQLVVNSNNMRLVLCTVPKNNQEVCSFCFNRPGYVFCRHSICFTFYCSTCFVKVHRVDDERILSPSFQALHGDHNVYICRNLSKNQQ